MTSEAVIQDPKELQKALDESARALDHEKHSKTFWKCLAIFIAGICLYETKSQIVWLPVADSPQMCVVMSDWWGLRAQVVYPVWRKSTGTTEEYSEKWCIQYPDNTWRVFYRNDGKPSDYSFPKTNRGAYF